MTVLATPEPAPATQDTGDSFTHAFCCDEDTAVCGTDLTHGEQVSDDEELTCVVCMDLLRYRCPKCGA